MEIYINANPCEGCQLKLGELADGYENITFTIKTDKTKITTFIDVSKSNMSILYNKVQDVRNKVTYIFSYIEITRKKEEEEENQKNKDKWLSGMNKLDKLKSM